MTNTYDAIVVGARCGGAATALLIARKGHKVLVLDRATFPSDTLSTHFVHLRGAAALGRWGLLEEVATATPAVERYSIDFGTFKVAGAPRPTPAGISTAYAPRRPTLDTILVRAACDAGAEVREGVTVQDVLWDDGRVVGVEARIPDGTTFTEHARIVIGADGRFSRIANSVGAEGLHERPTFAASYYAYWSGVPVDGLEVYVRPARSYGAFPTEDGLTLVVMSWPIAEFSANRHDVEGNFMKALEMAPSLHERVAHGTRETRFRGTGDVPGYYRQSFGPGWALVGDARHHKDPCTAQGISDAFADAERLTEALDEVWSGATSEVDALRRYHHDRLEPTLPMYDFTCQLASLEPPPPEMAALLQAVSCDSEASRDFVSVLAGTNTLPAFLSTDNIEVIMARPGAPPEVVVADSSHAPRTPC